MAKLKLRFSLKGNMAIDKQNYKYLGLDNPRKINWFPGHMAKAMRDVQKKIKLVDLVLEIRDARLPLMTANPKMLQMLGQKKRLIILNKANLADEGNLAAWKAYLKTTGEPYLFINALNPKTIKGITPMAQEIMKANWDKFKRKGINPPPLRMMVLGLPNTGKSTLINRFTKRNAANTGDRPGVTRHQEWIHLGKEAELLDTPGIMMPRIDTEYQGLCLSAIYAIRDEILGPLKVAHFVLDMFIDQRPEALTERYGIETEGKRYSEIIHDIAMRLVCLKKEGEIDDVKTSILILKDFREGRLGSLLFETPPEGSNQE